MEIEGNEAQRQGSAAEETRANPFQNGREGCGIRELETRRRAPVQEVCRGHRLWGHGRTAGHGAVLISQVPGGKKP